MVFYLSNVIFRNTSIASWSEVEVSTKILYYVYWPRQTLAALQLQQHLRYSRTEQIYTMAEQGTLIHFQSFPIYLQKLLIIPKNHPIHIAKVHQNLSESCNSSWTLLPPVDPIPSNWITSPLSKVSKDHRDLGSNCTCCTQSLWSCLNCRASCWVGGLRPLPWIWTVVGGGVD